MWLESCHSLMSFLSSQEKMLSAVCIYYFVTNTFSSLKKVGGNGSPIKEGNNAEKDDVRDESKEEKARVRYHPC